MLNKIVKICLFGLLLTSVLGIKSGLPVPSDSSANLEDFEWMVGLWKRESSRGAMFEKWIKVSDRTYEGLAYRMKDGDQQVTEHLRLEQFGSEIFYTAKPRQNPYPVPFKLVEFENSTAVFENPGHDFPQKFIYKLKASDSLHVRIEGPGQNGATAAVDFYFSKVK